MTDSKKMKRQYAHGLEKSLEMLFYIIMIASLLRIIVRWVFGV